MKSLLESAPERCSAPPFSSRSVLMGSDDGCIHHRAIFVDVVLQRLEQTRPDATLGPLIESIVDSFPAPEAWRQIPPRSSRLGYPYDGVDEIAVTTNGAPSSTMPKTWFEFLPLFIGELVSTH